MRKHSSLSYTDRVPWNPINRRMVPRRNGTLYRYRDAAGVDWWSDGTAIFQGEAPGYLRRAYGAAGLPVDVPGEPLLFALVRDLAGTPLGAPIAAYQVISEVSHDVVPVAVFAADEGAPELHVDARYLAYAEARFNAASFWRVYRAIATVRSARGLLGIVEGRDLPPPRGRQR